MLNVKMKKEDYFNDPKKRILIFEKDNWICEYYGEEVIKDNATLDHYIPQSKGGKNIKDNLRTLCLVCNAIESGKVFEQAAPFVLKSIQEGSK